MINNQPRILVISNNAISNSNANGKTLISLLGQFHEDNVAQIFIRPEIPEGNISSKFYRITDSEKMKSLFERKKTLGKVVSSASSPRETSTQYSSKSEAKIFSKTHFTESGFARYLRERIWMNKRGSFAKLHQFVESFNPSVILLYASRSAFMLDMATDLALKYNVPLVIYTSEDEYFHKVPWYRFFARKCLKMLKTAYSRAIELSSTVIVNHDQLAQHFRNEFNTSVKVIHQSSLVQPSIQPIDSVTPYFLYAGNVTTILHRRESLIQIAETLREINPEYHLHVFATNASQRTIKLLKKNSNIIMHEPVGADTLKEIVSHATIVFHAESFKRSVKGLIQNSFSSKIPDLLGSGRPVVVFAPSYCAFYPYLKKEQATTLASTKPELEEGIRKILADPSYRQNVIEKSLALFNKNHLQLENSKTFYDEIINAEKTVKKHMQVCTAKRDLRLNRWLVPVLFLYFVFSLFPTMIPNIPFIPNIFTSTLIELAWKGLLFIALSAFFLFLMIQNHLRFNWKFAIPLSIYALSNLIVIALIPASTFLSSINSGSLIEYEVVISLSTKIAGIFQVLSTIVLTYIFIILMPKTILFKRQFFLLLYLILGFLVLCGFYSIVFEKDTILGLFSADNPYYFNVHSIFEDKNTYGKYLLGGIMISCYLASQSKIKWQFSLTAFLFVCLITTLSKTPIMAAIVFFALLFIYYVFVRFERNLVLNSILLGLSLVLVVYLGCLLTIPALQVLPINDKIFHYLTVSVFQSGIGTVDSRVLIWNAAIDLLSGWHLFFGYGEKIASSFLLGNTTVFINYPNQYFHNGLLQVANIGGLLYLALYFALFVYLFVVYFKIGKIDKDSRFVFFAMFITFCIHASFEEAILSSTSVYSFILSMVLIVAPIMTLRMQKTDYIAEIKKDVAMDETRKHVTYWKEEKPVINDLNEIPMEWYEKELDRRFKNMMIKKIAKEEKYNLKMKKWRDKHAWNE